MIALIDICVGLFVISIVGYLFYKLIVSDKKRIIKYTNLINNLQRLIDKEREPK